MALRDRLLALHRQGRSWEEIGDEAQIPAGQAYLIVTGRPADGSDAVGPEFLSERGDLLMHGSQALSNPPTEVPTEHEVVDRWLKARAAADGPMQDAARRRTAEPPPIDDDSDSDDVVDVLGHQHGQVKFLMEQLEAIPGVRVGGSEEDQQRRVSIVDMMRVRLSQHESMEEAHFWPAVREHLEQGEDLAAGAEEQEQRGKDLLQELDGKPGGDDEFDELVEQLVLALRTHVAYEDTVFLKVKEQMPDDVRAKVGSTIKKKIAKAPTRPHPHAPAGTGMAAKVAAAGAAPLDKARDAMGERPAKRKGKEEE
ncbi:hemerythrin domain-containing protein [Nocardioides terrisoli]|uniref:hemerythrin domain-containing protein n=1 Tax=Nocardioides terrisoli TaxID=3388267 RepID=UPI00287BB072|nr:hemerythrin domain-containing protein [Nocardioides marmorisolisilvae]